jgi:aminomethyltransferase
MSALRRTPLYDLHQSLGAKMVPFAGYEMPVQYPLGVMKEHTHTRTKAGLFDVSHMGQAIVKKGSYEATARALEAVIPVDILGLGQNRQRYGFLTNDAGGIMDDLMLANREDHVFVVVNAACKTSDIAYLKTALGDAHVTELTDRALLALQGPAAETVLSALDPRASDMRFMDVGVLSLSGVEAWVSRSGYTGEDGFEISVPNGEAQSLAEQLLKHTDVEPIGLGARDSLRLEAGLCLYGHDIDDKTTPVEAGLTWAIQKVRRLGGDREGGFPGAKIILDQLEQGVPRKRVGLLPEGRAPMREGVALYKDEQADTPFGRITSGGFGPTVAGPIAMGFLPAEHCVEDTRVFGELRGKRLPLVVSKLPFTPANFKR